MKKNNEKYPELTVPRSTANSIFLAILYLIVLLFSILAITRLLNDTALVASIVWLILVIWLIWNGCVDEKVGLGKFLINRLGDVVGRKYMLIDTHNTQSTEIHFGFQLFGHRFTSLAYLLRGLNL